MKVVAQLSITVKQKKWLENKAKEKNKSMSLIIRELINEKAGDEIGK